MKTTHFDVFVIGSGIAGQTVAEQCTKNNLKVAIADHKVYGGTCANRGCDPKKILIQFSEFVEQSNRLKEIGIKKKAEVNWKRIQKFKNDFVNLIPSSTEKKLKELGIKLYHQSPKFISKTEVKVEGKKVTADKFVIATGKTPRTLNIKGNHLLRTSEDILNLKELPDSAVFIGGGYVGIEFANMLAVLGTKVTVIQNSAEILSNFDQFLVTKLVEKLKKIGVKFIFNADVKEIEKLRKNHRVHYHVKGKKKEITCNIVFNTAGRKPSIDKLNLTKANIKSNKRGVVVNDYLQSKTNPRVYACGDVSSLSLPLTPLSSIQGEIVSKNILNDNTAKFEYPLVPTTVFTTPNLSAVGLSETDAKKNYKKIKIYQGDVSEWYNAKKSKQSAYAYKLIVNERTGVILGAHVLSEAANENINLFVNAINAKMKVDQFKKSIYTYPSFSNDLKSMFA